MGFGWLHPQHDVALFFFKLEHDLEPGELIRCAELKGGCGTDEIHGFQAVLGPQSDIPEVKARILLLKKYSHTLHSALPGYLGPRSTSPRGQRRLPKLQYVEFSGT
jgi:hypothetical protein